MSPDACAAAAGPGQILASGVWKRFVADRDKRSILRDPARLVRPRQWRWVLSDIDLRIDPGESVGLVGANGSGKSTLLKLLCGVMYPYAGSLSTGGEIGPLIEVQAGLHPDLTGRENIGLYGAFLGISERRIAARFDDIVDFAEVGDAIGRPVRFYSSGMKMRLGFAVAALLEPHVLLIDEVLAVGDTSFQQRCLEQLQHARTSGTTLVFVSHDLSAVRAVCDRAIWLADGRIQRDGAVDDVLGNYREDLEARARTGRATGPLRLTGLTVADGQPAVPSNTPLQIKMELDAERAQRVLIHLGITEGPAAPVMALQRELVLSAGATTVTIELDGLPLGRGRYAVWMGASSATRRASPDELIPWHPSTDIEVTGPVADPAPPGVSRAAPLHVGARWVMGDDRPNK
jgi:ABC-type polysaccharide/polyol phosphate transport system ATPase subunit